MLVKLAGKTWRRIDSSSKALDPEIAEEFFEPYALQLIAAIVALVHDTDTLQLLDCF